MLSMARVVAAHPESHSVDIVMMDDGRRFSGVQVLAPIAGGDVGFNDIPEPTVTDPTKPFESGNTGSRDIYGVVAFMGPNPVVLGFLFPQVAQCLFPDKNRMVYRHSSGVYFTIDGSGNTELRHPSGVYFRVATDPAHEDLTAQDFDKRWSVPDLPAVAVRLATPKTTFNAAISGDVTLSTIGNMSISASGTVSISAGGAMTLNGSTIDLN